MQNYFDTLNAALDSEGLLDLWPVTASVPYNATVGLAAQGRWLSIYRDERGPRTDCLAVLMPMRTHAAEYAAATLTDTFLKN